MSDITDALPVVEYTKLTPLKMAVLDPTPETPFVRILVTTGLAVPVLVDGEMQIIPVPVTRYEIPIDGVNAKTVGEKLVEAADLCIKPSNIDIATNMDQVRAVANQKAKIDSVLKV